MRAPFTYTIGMLGKHEGDNRQGTMTEEPTILLETRYILPTCHSLRLFTLMVHEMINPDGAAPIFMPTSNMAPSHYPLGHKCTCWGVINGRLIKPGGNGPSLVPCKSEIAIRSHINHHVSIPESSLSHLGEPPHSLQDDTLSRTEDSVALEDTLHLTSKQGQSLTLIIPAHS